MASAASCWSANGVAGRRARRPGRAGGGGGAAGSGSSPSGRARLSSRASGLFGSSRSCQGSCRGPRKPACWPGQVSGPSTRRSAGPRRWGGRRCAGGRVERGGVAREVVARGDPVEVAGARGLDGLAGQDLVDGQQVVPLRVRHRADDRQLVGPRGQAGQVLADLDAGHGRVDRLELAADRRRGPRASCRTSRAGPARRSGGSRSPTSPAPPSARSPRPAPPAGPAGPARAGRNSRPGGMPRRLIICVTSGRLIGRLLWGGLGTSVVERVAVSPP